MLKRKFVKSDAAASCPASTRRTNVCQNTFSITLPQPDPHLILPPTPTSPGAEQQCDGGLNWGTTEPLLPPTPPSITTALNQSGPLYNHGEAQTTTGVVSEDRHGDRPLHPSQSPAPTPSPLSLGALHSKTSFHPYLLEKYAIVDELGSGGHGVVLKAIRRCDSQAVAVKVFLRSKLSAESWVSVTGWDPRLLSTAIKVPREAFTLRQIKHAGVVSFLDFFEDEYLLYLVMEHFGAPWNQESPLANRFAEGKLCSGTATGIPAQAHPSVEAVTPLSARPHAFRRPSCDLFECLEKFDSMPEDVARGIFKQLAETVYHLHRQGIVHCDLKDENIVIDANFRVKLIDFGSALILDPMQPAPFIKKFQGTINFAAPEILRSELFQAPQAEIWAMGCILSILLTGRGPFPSAEAAVQAKICQPRSLFSDLAYDLLSGCLQLHPAKRLNIYQVATHPWLNAQ